MENLKMTKQRTANVKNNQQNQNNEFFNLKTTGLGYVNYLEERESSKNGELFTTCTVAALVGPKNAEKRQYRYINVVVVGEENIELLWNYHQDLLEERKVLIRFCVNDIKAKAFQRGQGRNSEIDASLQATLYVIDKVWLDGALDYDASSDAQQDEVENVGYDEKRPAQGRQTHQQPKRSSAPVPKGASKSRAGSRSTDHSANRGRASQSR